MSHDAYSDNYMCMSQADMMSCATMTRMAKNEVARDFQIRTFVASSPTCAFMHEYRDIDQELLMLTGSLTKNQCFDPCTLDKSGQWENQFSKYQYQQPLSTSQYEQQYPSQSRSLYGGALELSRPVPQCFDARTRPR